jgi:hypothetical protein
MRRRIASVVAAMCLVALGAPTLKAQINPNGWIQSDGWTFLVLNGPGCDGGGAANMLGNWVAPHNIGMENPRAGDVWDNIDHNGASRSTGNAWDDSLGETWVSLPFLESNFPGSAFPNGDVVNFQDEIATVISANNGAGQPFDGLADMDNDNVVSIATTYVRNNTGGTLPVQVCGASDDSMQIMVNNCVVVNTPACRGTAGDCEANTLATIGLPNGISKITVLVWEGGGGWGFRFAIRNTGGARYNDASTEVDFLGPGTTEIGQTNDCVDFIRAYVPKPFNYPLDTGEKTTVTLSGASVGAAGTMFHLEETVSVNDPSTLQITNITGGGTLTPNTLPDRTETVITGAMLTETVHVGADTGALAAEVANGDGSFTSTDSSNGDLWDGGDTFQFRYTMVSGDFDISAEILDYVPKHPDTNYAGQNRWGRVGLMARQFDDPLVTPISGQIAARYDAVFNHGPTFVEQAFNQGRNTHNTAAGHHQFGIGGNPQKARFHRVTRRGNIVQCWASNNPGLGNGTLNPRNDANWQGGTPADWGSAPDVLVGFANGHHGSWGAANPQTVTYRILPAGGTGGTAPASYTIKWDIDRTTLAGGVKYDIAYDGRQESGHTFSLVGPNVLAKPGGAAGVPFDNTQTGPLGTFSNSHDIGYPRTRGSTTYNAGTDTYTMTSSGDDIWAGGDFFQFAYEEVTGDFEATVRISNRISPEWDGRWGKHGLMARNTADFNARYTHVQTYLATNPAEIDTPRHAHRVNQFNTGATRENYDAEGGVFPDLLPEHMKLIRRGSSFWSYLADDDGGGNPVAWKFLGHNYAPDATATQLVGMALTGHAGNEIGRIEFTDYTLTLLPSCQDGDCSSGAPIAGAATDFNIPDGALPAPFITVTGGGFAPAVAAGRLRLTSEAVAGSANAVWFPTDGGNLAAIGFTVEFDAFMTRAGLPGDANPADGFTFAVVEGNAAYGATARGDGGGSLGFEGNNLRGVGGHASFAVEMDNWLGGGEPANEPAGTGSPDNDGKYHMGIDVAGSVGSILTNVEFTGNTNLPNIFDPAGIHVEVSYRPEGRVDVLVTGNDGSFPRTHVLSHCIPPLTGADLLIGWTAATGGATCTQEVDNASLNLSCCETTYDSVAITGNVSAVAGSPVALSAALAGADGAPTFTWSLVAGGATLSATTGPAIDVTPTAPGVVTVRVEANDGSCDGAFDLHTICAETTADVVTIAGAASAGIGESETLTATLTGADGAATYAWSALPTGVVTITDNGDGTAAVKCDAEGDVVVTVAANDGSCGPGIDTHDFECVGGGNQRIGDENQDGALNISDPVSVLNHLFGGTNPSLPCGDGTIDDAGNKALLDVNASNTIDISDPVWVLNFLFAGGPIMRQCPANPCLCQRIAGCPDAPCVDA